MNPFSRSIITTRGRLLAVVALLAVIAYAPSAFAATKSTREQVRTALQISKRADKNARKALKAVGSGRIKNGAVLGIDLADGIIGTPRSPPTP